MSRPPKPSNPHHMQILATHLLEAGWHGRNAVGWLFAAHVMAEHEADHIFVITVLHNHLCLSRSASLEAAASSIINFVRDGGPYPREDIDALESGVSWLVRCQSDDLGRARRH